MTSVELIEEERLDIMDPLRHLRNEDDDTLVPTQPPSIHRQIQVLKIGHISLQLLVDAGPGCGGITWPSGQVLSKYLVSRGSRSLQNRHVLELGSGTGLVGLIAAQLGPSKVTITDQFSLLDIMNQNIALNNLQDIISSLELDWGNPLPQLDQIDTILAADCVYFEASFSLLVQTLVDLCKLTSSNAEILFCYKHRRKADKRFFSLLKKSFTWTEVDDDPDREIYRKEGISLLRLHSKSRH